MTISEDKRFFFRVGVLSPGLLFPLLVFLLGFMGSCNHEKQTVKLEGYAQGTTYHITYLDSAGRIFQSEVDSLFRVIDRSMSTYDSSSVISRVNNNDTSAIPDEHFLNVFNMSMQVSEITNGAFDMTVGPLVNAWGFGFKKAESIDSAAIDSLLQFVGFKKVALMNGKVIKENPGVMLDFNAIAQGYTVDVICSYLEERNIQNYLVEVGGELRAKGVSAKNIPWVVGIDKPEENPEHGRMLQAKVKLKDMAVATSGSYRRFYEKEGKKYSHTINPETGYPVQHSLLSASVFTGDAMTADALATAFMVMGLEKSIAFVESPSDVDVYFIYSDLKGNFKTYMTPGLKDKLEENKE